MRRFAAILLLLSMAALGSGALRYVHELEHLAADTRAGAAHNHDEHAHEHENEGFHGDDESARHPDPHPHPNPNPHHHRDDPSHGHGPGDAPVHGPADCFIHAQLNLPLHDAGYVPVLVCVGRFQPLAESLPASRGRSRRPALLLDSRGPPPAAPFLQFVHVA